MVRAGANLSVDPVHALVLAPPRDHCVYQPIAASIFQIRRCEPLCDKEAAVVLLIDVEVEMLAGTSAGLCRVSLKDREYARAHPFPAPSGSAPVSYAGANRERCAYPGLRARLGRAI